MKIINSKSYTCNHILFENLFGDIDEFLLIGKELYLKIEDNWTSWDDEDMKKIIENEKIIIDI